MTLIRSAGPDAIEKSFALAGGSAAAAAAGSQLQPLIGTPAATEIAVESASYTPASPADGTTASSRAEVLPPTSGDDAVLPLLEHCHIARSSVSASLLRAAEEYDHHFYKQTEVAFDGHLDLATRMQPQLQSLQSKLLDACSIERQLLASRGDASLLNRIDVLMKIVRVRTGPTDPTISDLQAKTEQRLQEAESLCRTAIQEFEQRRAEMQSLMLQSETRDRGTELKQVIVSDATAALASLEATEHMFVRNHLFVASAAIATLRHQLEHRLQQLHIDTYQ